MGGDVIHEAPTRPNVSQIRCHDYLYDSSFIVSGARDYARTAFKAAMESAQVMIQPVYNCMFSAQRSLRPSIHVVYHPNCRLPEHVDRSYGAYLKRLNDTNNAPISDINGKNAFKFIAIPKKLLCMSQVSPDFRPNTPVLPPMGPPKPRNRGTQSLFRESSAQTIPWQPDGKAADNCKTTPEVLYLDELKWGTGRPYRTGDLPADFHTTEMINKMRHARAWMELVEVGKFPRWMKKRDAIIDDVVVKDWLFRQAEIDELQEIRLELLHRLQEDQRQKKANRTSLKLSKLWNNKKQEMENKINNIRKKRDRELRKLKSIHESGGRVGLLDSMKSSRGTGMMTTQARDPSSDMYAPVARHGYQARRRHAAIMYDPTLLSLEDHKALSEPPEWLTTCGQDLTKTCSGHHLVRDPNMLCERETKWSEQFLENLHENLKKARLGAAKTTVGPLHVLKARKEPKVERPVTPTVEAVEDQEETAYQAALVLQRIIRGRAVQHLMYEGRTRAAELTEELKTTHGLQKEDKARIAKEESKAREYNMKRMENEAKEDTLTALVDELCGGAVSAALDFLEKELQRLKEERRQHAYLMIAMREKAMREAAEAGRRQKEEERRREHDEMFKQILGVTQGTVETYLKEIVEEGVELAAEADAENRAKAQAKLYDQEFIQNPEKSTAATNELVAELVQQFLLPHTSKTAARHHISMLQNMSLEAARRSIFRLIDDGKENKEVCLQCGEPLDEDCRCPVCPVHLEPTETKYRHDPRWKHARSQPVTVKTYDERYPMSHEMRCMLNDLLDDVVKKSRLDRVNALEAETDIKNFVDECLNITLDCKHYVDTAIDVATGKILLPVKKRDYHYYMRHSYPDALPRSTAIEPPVTCPKELPSVLRSRAEEEAARLRARGPCLCKVEDEEEHEQKEVEDENKILLPSDVRKLEELRRCKCDEDQGTLSPDDTTEYTSSYGFGMEAEEQD